jgi:CheY-like chemotaxis protein
VCEKTVVIADDVWSMRLLARSSLTRDPKIRVLEAANGTDALALVRQEVPDLVLLDVGMPGMDGYSVCRAIRSDPSTAGITVLMLTAWTQEQDKQRGLEAGANEYLKKPFSPVKLLDVVRGYLGLPCS